MDCDSTPHDGASEHLVLEVGKVAGAMTVLASEVASIRGEMTGVTAQLALGNGKMIDLDNRLLQLHDQVKIANSRTTKLEQAVAIIERKWAAATYVLRMADKLAEHKIVGLFFAVFASGAAGATLQRFL